MDKLPTAEDVLDLENDLNNEDIPLIVSRCIKFAEFHVEQALKEASKKAKTKEDIAIFAEGTFETQIVDKDSILNAYPLTNIK